MCGLTHYKSATWPHRTPGDIPHNLSGTVFLPRQQQQIRPNSHFTSGKTKITWAHQGVQAGRQMHTGHVCRSLLPPRVKSALTCHRILPLCAFRLLLVAAVAAEWPSWKRRGLGLMEATGAAFASSGWNSFGRNTQLQWLEHCMEKFESPRAWRHAISSHRDHKTGWRKYLTVLISGLSSGPALLSRCTSSLASGISAVQQKASAVTPT